MTAYFNSTEIIKGSRSAVTRAIKRRRKEDPQLKVKFSGEFDELECALYDLRSGFLTFFRNNYSYPVQQQAVRIEFDRVRRETANA